MIQLAAELGFFISFGIVFTTVTVANNYICITLVLSPGLKKEE
ncbi:hypothetical protein JCM19297_291 [Nonlabens ulvanivorans]|nr:hypothetical protein JCM19297_291 [Nonlabens ulvanivorans]